MYQALYRKWRPRTFDEVCGQEHITSILKYELAVGRQSHAYLLCGSRGTGKTTCAKIIAKAANCLDPKDGNPCGVCEACRSIDEGRATDVVEMDAASNTGVEYIRDIRDEVVYTPAELKCRVYIIDEVHMLTTQAFNALLKTLEEPPPQVMFILATTEPQKIPATILSRCQRFDFRRIESRVIADRLLHIASEEKIGLDDGAAMLIARLSQGGMRDAISLLELCAGSGVKITREVVESVAGTVGREGVYTVVKAVLDADYEAIFACVAKLYAESKDIGVFWQDLISYYRDLMIMKSVRDPAAYLDLTAEELSGLAELSSRMSMPKLIAHSKLLDDAMRGMQNGRGGEAKRLCAELALVRLTDDKLTGSAESLLSRVSALEDKLSMGNFSAGSFAQDTPKDEPKEQEATPGRKLPESPEEKPDARKEARDDAPEKAQPKLLRAIGFWSDCASKLGEYDHMTGSFLAGSKAYAPDDSPEVFVRLASKFAVKMCDKDGVRAQISSLLNSFGGGKLRTTPQSIVFSAAEEDGDADEYKYIDEIIENNRKEENT